MLVRLHFNRRSKDGLVWSIRTSKVCYHASKVYLRVKSTTEFKPDNDRNPKAFIVAEANKITMFGKDAIIE